MFSLMLFKKIFFVVVVLNEVQRPSTLESRESLVKNKDSWVQLKTSQIRVSRGAGKGSRKPFLSATLTMVLI